MPISATKERAAINDIFGSIDLLVVIFAISRPDCCGLATGNNKPGQMVEGQTFTIGTQDPSLFLANSQ
jgi:hypothetical protein